MKTVIFILALIFSMSCSLEEKTEDTGDKSNLNETMLNVENTSRKLFIYTWADDKSITQSESNDILKLVKSLREDFHKVRNLEDERTEEVGFKSILSMQNRLLADIQLNLENKNFEFAKWQLKGITHNCFMCHSRVPALQDKISQKIVLNDTSFESRLAEVEYLVASRQFQLAESNLYNLAADLSHDEFSQANSVDALRFWILLQVRVRGDLKKASNSLASLINDGKFNTENKTILDHWVDELKIINSEKYTLEKYKNLSSGVKLGLIIELLGDLDKKSTEKEDELNLVRTTFASSLLHQLHFDDSDIDISQEVLALLGISYSRINIPSLKSLSPNYYVECIESKPKTKWAKICYTNWKNDFEYLHTGSSGLNLTKEDHGKIEHLKALSY